MNDLQVKIFTALLNKIKNDNKAFFCTNYFNLDLINWKYIEGILNDFYRVTENEIELITKNKIKEPFQLIQGNWIRSPKPSPKYVIKQINKGCTLVILGGSRINKTINHISHLIESLLPNTTVDTHVYCGLKGSKSFKAHYDNADNIIFHQSGSCNWKVYKQVAADCNYEHNVNGKDLDIEFETVLHPGDMIYVPQHQYHEAVPLEKRISLSFPIVQGTPIDRNWYSIR